ncbi:SDR family NAD(P)-dependent oxidoreductase [Pseudooceanicola onchidii]|uniref:SDR family NAD(P)-dependent oxidoreductase n=1 Tax=Pseudooceanicola onchidii TaxID=2562279 RepID=UPI0010AA306F|nr:SDR family oxidoreductase [Pseudooceanicola onchidii]
MSWLNLENRIAFVTGAAGGIGSAIARSFAAEGVRLAIFDRDADGLARTAESLGPGHVARPLDLSDTASIAPTLRAAAETSGAPTILVNVAAMSLPSALADVSEADFNLQMTVNMTAALLTAQTFRKLRAPGQPGAIVNISSIAATHAVPLGSAYSPGKAALSMLTQQQAVEWGPEGLRSNMVSPGLILTPLSERFYADPMDREARENVVPSRRIGTPQDIADAVLFLASDRADYVNGAEILVDGGFTRTLMTHIPRKRMAD